MFSDFLKPNNPLIKKLEKYKKYIFALLGINLIHALDLSLRPYIVKIILDRLAQGGGFHALIIPVVYYLGMSFFIILVFRFYDLINLNFFPKLKADIINQMMKRTLSQDYAFYQNRLAGTLSEKIGSVARSLPEVLKILIDRFFASIMAIVFASITLFFIHPIFSLILFIWTAIFVIITYKCSKKSYTYSQKSAYNLNGVFGNITDSFMNILNIKCYANERYETEKLYKNTSEYVHSEKKFLSELMKIKLLQGVYFLLLQTTCLIVLLYYNSSMFTIGDFSLIFTINIYIIDYLWNISNDYNLLIEHLAKISQGLSSLDDLEEDPKTKSQKDFVIKAGEIQLKNISFRYTKKSYFQLTIPKLKIKKGTKVALVGRSGSGKTTLINLLLRMYDLEAGKILIDNQDVSKIDKSTLLKQIATMPQNSQLFHTTVRENIQYANLNATQKDIEQAAAQAFAKQFIDRLSEKYETVVGEKGLKLSGGQIQRLLLARTILKSAPILLLDEITSSLDVITEKEIYDNLLKAYESKTIIIAAHRLVNLSQLDRILVFDQGEIVEDGSHDDLLGQEGLYKLMWESQQSYGKLQQSPDALKAANL